MQAVILYSSKKFRVSLFLGDDYVDCEVEEPGDLGSHMMWTIPNMVMREAELSEKDKKDLQFAVDHDVSWRNQLCVSEIKDQGHSDFGLMSKA